MYHVEEKEIETIHLYVVREEVEKKPYTFLPLLLATLCLVGIVALTLYSGEHPYFEQETLRVPAVLLPPTSMSVSEQIVPTGIKTYPATTAHGILTITNGSIISQIIPQGFTLDGVATDTSVFVPAGSAEGFGYATVQAHALVGGTSGNVAALAINQVEGSSVYIRNLTAFHGGQDAYSVQVVTKQDRLTALMFARNFLLSEMPLGLRVRPCTEVAQISKLLTLTWTCQFAIYHVPTYMKVLSARIQGNAVLVDVSFVARPKIIVTK